MVIEVLIVFGHVTICSSATSVSALDQGPSDAVEYYVLDLHSNANICPCGSSTLLTRIRRRWTGDKRQTAPSIRNSLPSLPRRLTSAYLLNCSITCLQLGSLNSIYHLSLVLLLRLPRRLRLLRACSRNGRPLPLSQNLIAPESALTKQS